LEMLAALVTVDQINSTNPHDVVRCMFPLGTIQSADAVQELSTLKLMTTPVVLSKTNQLLITDTAAKLKSVKAVLDAFATPATTPGMEVKNFPLQHADAEDVLAVARPHLGLATGEMIGIDVSISIGSQGKNLFVTGASDKLKLIEDFITVIDKPQKGDHPAEGLSELRSHLVEGGNVETVYNVLQTMLAGKSVRLSMDKSAGSVVALASPEVQREIEQTVHQLQVSAAEFEVIPLKIVDPYFAISLLEQMLPTPSALDPKSALMDSPKIDADPGNRRLFVRGKRHQIEQVKKIISGLDVASGFGDRIATNDPLRILPYRGKQADLLIETAAKFWRADNPIVLYPPMADEETENTERIVGEDDSLAKPTANELPAEEAETARVLTPLAKTNAPAIRCQRTQRGLLLQSDDTEALNLFEEFLRTIAGPVAAKPTPPIVFYLKHTKVDDALRMLRELIDGGEAANDQVAGTLVKSYVPATFPGSLPSTIVTSQDGTTTMMAGAITVVADARLNRLIAQGTTEDIQRIEGYLKIIDKDNSITSIVTYGESHVLELENTKASDVAAAIKEAFSSRIAGSGASGANSAANPQSIPQQLAAEAAAKEGGDPKKVIVMQPPRNLEPKMTIALHEPSNSLIVTAPDQLFDEVERLVRTIDARGAEAVEVISPVNGELVGSVLQQVLFGEVASSAAKSSSKNRSSSSSTSSSSRSKSDR
jgi:type II secretory pathway component GspD/PulD (secretin)